METAAYLCSSHLALAWRQGAHEIRLRVRTSLSNAMVDGVPATDDAAEVVPTEDADGEACAVALAGLLIGGAKGELLTATSISERVPM
jgi:hypothetical protein